MAVYHDYKCPAHGFFESNKPECPHGCTADVQMVFLQPVGMKSDRTKHADTTLKDLANDYGMSDIKSARQGDHQNHALLQNKQAAQPQNPFGVQWGNPSQLSNYNLTSIRGETVGGLSAARESGIALRKPQPSVVIRDHENLKLAT
jgi:hypothetical protein